MFSSLRILQKILLIFLFVATVTLSGFSAEQLMPMKDLPGLNNFAKISEILYRGAQPEAPGFAELKKMGVKTVISLRANHGDIGLMKGLGLQYIRIPINIWNMEDEDVVKFLKVVTDPKNQPVFVHCQHGSDRTGTMVAIYRIYVQGWTLEEAMKELPAFGFHEIWKNLPIYLQKLDLKKIRKQVESAKAPKIKLIK